MRRSIGCFKAYDLRGRVPDELDEDIAWRVGRAFAAWRGARRVALGRDVRASSDALAAALARGLNEGGADVADLGLCGTEEIYFAADRAGLDGGIMITASHNPPDYNGMKLVRDGARPVSADSGLADLRRLAEAGDFPRSVHAGTREPLDTSADYIAHLLGYVDRSALRPLRIVANAGNGMAGRVIERLEAELPFEFVKVQFEPDGSFPNGVPNPLLPETRGPTIDAVRASAADLGIAWDGDFDRCFLFDERGAFIEGYYIVGLLAAAFLAKSPGERIVHDPRLTWNTIDVVRSLGGVPVQTKAGHAFIKERMRAEDAVYGGEMSAHHYFRDFAYCDSGMIPWLLVTEIMSRTGKPLSALVGERIAKFPASGEINRRVADAGATIAKVRARYAAEASTVDLTDGLSMEFARWRFNLRSSNTEPLIRLNVETRAEPNLLETKTTELLGLLDA
jgi:phosphomannomutase/phosphomannomutase/phosphoglucomutase